MKVRCQAAGISSRQVLHRLAAASGGSWPALLSALYAGALPAAALSIVVGSVHYVCFSATRRALSSLLGKQQQGSSGAAAAPAAASGARGDHHTGGGHVMVSHGATGSHYLHVDEADQQQQQQRGAKRRASSGSTSSSSEKGSAAGGGDGSSSGAGRVEPPPAAASDGSLAVNILSAVITAAITALVEAPLETFRHNSQAGTICGNFVLEMIRVARRSGPRALYCGLLPYCAESWPYDISE